MSSEYNQSLSQNVVTEPGGEQQQNNIPDLIQYLRVLKKRKVEILIIFFITMIISTIISLLLPKTYETDSVIEIGIINMDPIESPADLKLTIKGKSTLKELAILLGQPDNEDNVNALLNKFDLTINPDSRLIIIKNRGNSAESAIQLNQIISDYIINKHHKAVEKQLVLIDKEIETINNQVITTTKDIAYLETINHRLNLELENDYKQTNSRLQTQSDAQARLAETYLKLTESHQEKLESNIQTINTLEQKIVELNFQIYSIENDKFIKNADTVMSILPVLPTSPISPNIINNTIIAAILGLFLGLISIYTNDYFEKNKKYFNQPK